MSTNIISADNLNRAAIVDNAFAFIPVRSHNRDEIESKAYEYLLNRIAKRGLTWDSIDLETLESIALSAMRDARRLLAIQYKRHQRRNEQLLPEQDWNQDRLLLALNAEDYAIVRETLDASLHSGKETETERIGTAIENRSDWSPDWKEACKAVAEYLAGHAEKLGTPDQISEIVEQAFIANGLDC